MLRLPGIAAALAWVWLALAGPVWAQTPNSPNVEADLQSARAAVAPGERFTIVLRQRIREGWHTYWRNPGDSGQPTRVTWRLPSGWRAGPIQWPAPTAMRFATLMSYVYSGDVLFPIELIAPLSAHAGSTITLSADGDWLVCSDICIPEHTVLRLAISIAEHGGDDPVWSSRIAAAVAALPARSGAAARITSGAPAILSIALPRAQAIRSPYFFPYSQDAIDHPAAQQPRVGASGLSFRLASGVDHNLGAASLAGVVTFVAADGTNRAFEIEATPGPPLPGTDAAPPPGASASSLGASAPAADLDALLAAITFAFLGGLILNVMPCVLPVLSVKALSLAAGAHTGGARREGVFYLAGVLATFLALAIVLVSLREGGVAAGWGFQLQNPSVTAGLALLYFVIGLNLLGVFSVGGGEGAAGRLAARGGDAGAFFTGMLAVVAATPCTAPFMAGAIGLALTQPAPVAFAIFTALALGFALPLTLLSFAPALQRLVPRSGAWMERVRNVLGFPMFVAAAWLVWVLAQQTGADGVLALLALGTALAFALVVARWGRAWIAFAVMALVLTAAFAWSPLTRTHAAAVTPVAWSEARLAQLRAEGRGVFVNFTAAWCVTCKVNEATLSSDRVHAAMQAQNIVYLEGDWTSPSDAIAAELSAHNHPGVPLYLYYAPGSADPVVLPQILSEGIVLRAIGAQR